VARYARLDLPRLDELGYVHLDPRGAELLFQIITAREERASIACASNTPFSEWGARFTDPRLLAAVVDRLTFNAHILHTGSASYRLNATTRARKGHHHLTPNPGRSTRQQPATDPKQSGCPPDEAQPHGHHLVSEMVRPGRSRTDKPICQSLRPVSTR
jgi:hypothetical protein